ncbi:MAG: hypothetical protein CL398_03420 [Acidiferrobacteraceae bacterium]|nr:hypothetical protein [Acidiferrobacteraceae bacterium]
MNTYKLFKNLRSFERGSSLKGALEFKKLALAEISQRSIDRIETWMDNAGPGQYTFDHMFGGTATEDGDWRRSFPIATREQRVAVDMMQTLRNLGWESAFEETGESYDSKQKKNVTRYGIYVKKETERVIPKGPRAGETVTKVDKRRIAQAIKQEHRDGNIDEKRAQDYLRLVTQKLDYYTMNPEELLTVPRLSIVVSRHPVDVLRMSDWAHIDSCHGEKDGSYFHCAVHEAKGQGLIAYAVATDDLEGIDLQAHEVFEDTQRHIRGIEPAGRVRLRRYENWRGGRDGQTYELAIPEHRVYGSLPPGFLDTLRDWALDSQIEYLERNDPDFKYKKDLFGNVEIEEYPDMDQFTRTGGSYKDTEASDTWNSFFDTEEYYGDTEEDYEGEEEEQEDRLWDQWEEQLEDTQRVYGRRADWVSANYYMEDYGEGQPYISFDCRASIEFDASDWLEPFPERWSEQSLYLKEIKELLEEVLDDPAVGEVEVNVWSRPTEGPRPSEEPQREIPGTEKVFSTITGKPTVEFYINPENPSDYYGDYGAALTPDDFERFADDVENNWDGAKELVEETIRNYLAQEGFLEPTEYDKLTNKVREEELEFKHFTTDLDGTTLSINSTFPIRHAAASGQSYIKVAEVIYPADWNMPWHKAMMMATGEVATPSSAGRGSLAHSNWFKDRLWGEVARENKEARRLMTQQMELPFPKEDPEHPGQYEIPGTPPRKAKSVPVWEGAGIYTGVFWPHKDQWGTENSKTMAHEVYLWINFVLDRSMAETGDLQKALAFLHYLDDNMEVIQSAARKIFAEIWPNFHKARKEEEAAAETKRTRRVHYIKTLLNRAKEVSAEDIRDAARNEAGAVSAVFAAIGAGGAMAEPAEETVQARFNHLQNKIKDLEGALQSHVSSAGVVQTGPRAGMHATWEDAPFDRLNSNYLAGHLLSLKQSLRQFNLRHLIPRADAPYNDPVPAKRDVYEEQITSLQEQLKKLESAGF